VAAALLSPARTCCHDRSALAEATRVAAVEVERELLGHATSRIHAARLRAFSGHVSGAAGRQCGPDRALAEMPDDGALVFVLEYRPARGSVWSGIHRSDFPPRPAHLRLPRRAPEAYECFGRGYQLHFRDADRPLQVMVAVGPKATAARRRGVERVLDGLRFSSLPPPPPDPYEGWPTLIDESGDSLRARRRGGRVA